MSRSLEWRTAHLHAYAYGYVYCHIAKELKQTWTNVFFTTEVTWKKWIFIGWKTKNGMLGVFLQHSLFTDSIIYVTNQKLYQGVTNLKKLPSQLLLIWQHGKLLITSKISNWCQDLLIRFISLSCCVLFLIRYFYTYSVVIYCYGCKQR